MSAEVKILIEGEIASDRPTITLIRDGALVMVVDPGILESQQVLIDALEKENLTVGDVNVVCITHSHLDHYRNIGMFPDAKVLEYFGLWGKYGMEHWSENFTSDIKIYHTPGHDYTSLTLFVETEIGTVAICGDVYWKENFPKDPHDDVYASNPAKLLESREMVLKMADWIIPGHGGIYKNNSGMEVPEEAPTITVEPKIVIKCKKCGREMVQNEKCRCRPFLCFRCCQCTTDCDLCSCSHKIFRKE
jgi:glyoxylase-like metal-dependent hydrolase (beta-lactamase superfamily II)